MTTDLDSGAPGAGGSGILEGEFVSATHVIVRDYDGGKHTFGPVVRTPTPDAPAAGDRAWLLEAPSGRYIVIGWEAAA